MVLGTSSGAGKSTVALMLCRAAKRMGLSVAPFKAQNMTPRSMFRNGMELPAPLVMQALACGVEPEGDMSPALVKYDGGRAVRLVVCGKDSYDYHSEEGRGMRARMPDIAKGCYDRVAARFPHMVLEGAGAALEPNLRAHDYINLPMATYAGAKTILVADIDRGGMYASVVGTLALMSAQERGLVHGVIVNRFHGDPADFAQGRKLLEELCGTPVLAVLPYTPLRLPQEDAPLAEDEAPETRSDEELLAHIDELTDVFERYADTAAVASLFR